MKDLRGTTRDKSHEMSEVKSRTGNRIGDRSVAIGMLYIGDRINVRIAQEGEVQCLLPMEQSVSKKGRYVV